MALKLIAQQYPELDAFPHLPVERGKNNNGVGQWVVKQKHLLLCKYITAARAAAKKFQGWIYIDPFSGPGRIQVRNEDITRPGGAAIAWMQAVESGVPFTKMLIGDIDESRVRSCEIRLGSLNAPVIGFDGPADETVLRMIAKVPKGTLCLVYIDPYNLALLSYKMIETLASLPYVDFIVHFSTMDLMRNIDAELDPDRARFDDVLPDWRARLGRVSKNRLPTSFFENWCTQVKSLGFDFSRSMPLITNDDQHGIYRLVCFSRSDLALRIWKDVAREPNRELF